MAAAGAAAGSALEVIGGGEDYEAVLKVVVLGGEGGWAALGIGRHGTSIVLESRPTCGS
jgi:hypothetical protein